MFRFIILFIITVIIQSCANAENHRPETTTLSCSVENDSIPLVVLRSFFNLHENIDLNELMAGIQSGKISCTSDAAMVIKDEFHIIDSLEIMSILNFPLTDTSQLIVTTLDSVIPGLLITPVNGSHVLRNREKYPLWVSHSSGFDFDKHVTSYTHTGVTALTRRTGTALNIMGNEKYIELIRPEIGSPDILHVSNEVSILKGCDYGTMKMKFSTRPEHFEVLNLLGVDVVELTGNHNMDVGQDAYAATMNWYRQNGMVTFGGGLTPQESSKPLILTLKDGKKIAWIGFNEFCPCGECSDISMGANRYNEIKASETVKALRNNVDYIIAGVQFGESDSYVPSATQKKISRFLIDNGVDLVIGSQAHQPQSFEFYRGRMIFYGIGNFMFDQIHRLGVRQAYFLECYFFKGRIIQLIPHFTFMGDDRRPAPANREQILAIKNAVYLPQYFIGN